MQTLVTIKKTLASTQDLQSVVRTMKILAAVNVRQYAQAAEAVADYTQNVEKGLQAVLRQAPAQQDNEALQHRGSRQALLFCGSEQGMCGQFNEQLLQQVERHCQELGVAWEDLYHAALGTRAENLLRATVETLDAAWPLPGDLTGLVAVLYEVLLQVERWRGRGVAEVWVAYNRPTGGASYDTQIQRVVPLDRSFWNDLQQRPWPTRALPTFRCDAEALLGTLVREWFFAVLYRAAVQSLAAENAARLAAMGAAEKNIKQRLEEIRGHYHHRRQSAITEELLDVVAGFEAMTRAEP